MRIFRLKNITNISSLRQIQKCPLFLTSQRKIRLSHISIAFGFSVPRRMTRQLLQGSVGRQRTDIECIPQQRGQMAIQNQCGGGFAFFLKAIIEDKYFYYYLLVNLGAIFRHFFQICNRKSGFRMCLPS
jgi:hypothetical protein